MTVLGFVSRLVGEGSSPPEDPDVNEDPDVRPRTRLFECPDCESVYLSADLSTCRSCDTSVERIASEHDLGFGQGDAGGD